MSVTAIRTSVGLTTLVGVLAAVLAGTSIWLLLTDPVRVAGAMEQGDLSPVLSLMARTIGDLLRALAAYL